MVYESHVLVLKHFLDTDRRKLSCIASTTTEPDVKSTDDILSIHVDDDIITDLDDYLIHGSGYTILGNDLYGAMYYYGYAEYIDRGDNNGLNATALRAYYGDQYDPTRHINADKYNSNPQHNPFTWTSYNDYNYDLKADNGLIRRFGFDCDWD